ncbi:SOS response-associated peptidase family protein [Edaphobacter aggregans]|uniref:SOS response-associated peptidase family protein n=1 Tax=Edaphobacter aggregans TaxID=570835 RepID=UPI000691B44C|nr:SOS response-associated peptidase family protein [Edaphobacter aggregans]
MVDDGTPSTPWDYNVAPTSMQPIIRHRRRELVLLRWGLIPFFTKDSKDVKGLSTVNARAETVVSRTYREPFKKRRYLVPASGFYEWRLDTKNKIPFAFDLPTAG